MVERLTADFLKISISLIAKALPIPRIGPIKGDINMAPMTTAVESAFNPTEATKTAKIRIQAVAPLKGMSAFMAPIVAS